MRSHPSLVHTKVCARHNHHTGAHMPIDHNHHSGVQVPADHSHTRTHVYGRLQLSLVHSNMRARQNRHSGARIPTDHNHRSGAHASARHDHHSVCASHSYQSPTQQDGHSSTSQEPSC